MADGSMPVDEQNAAPEPEVAKATEAPKKGVKRVRRVLKLSREQSSIAFPYMDLDAGITVAKALLEGGGVALSREQLAGVMGQSVGSGNFITKVSTARLFGLVGFSQSKYELTDLGFDIVDSNEQRRRAAKARAFLNVPLYARTYEEFRGRQLPPRPQGLEQAFVKFGVAQKQKANARLAFDKSAQQAGFFAAGTDRLIEPILAGGGSPPPDRGRIAEGREPEDQRAAAPEATPGFHPFIQGLLDTLPEPGTNWTVEGRAKWLQAAAHIFDLIYTGSGEITISSRSKPEDTQKPE